MAANEAERVRWEELREPGREADASDGFDPDEGFEEVGV